MEKRSTFGQLVASWVNSWMGNHSSQVTQKWINYLSFKKSLVRYLNFYRMNLIEILDIKD